MYGAIVSPTNLKSVNQKPDIAPSNVVGKRKVVQKKIGGWFPVF